MDDRIKDHLRTYKLRDGSQSVCFRYRFKHKDRSLTLGNIDKIGEEEIERRAKKAYMYFNRGIDPAKRRNEIILAGCITQSFRAVCDRYCDMKIKAECWKPKTESQNISNFERLIFPYIGDIPIDQVKTSDVVHMMNEILEEYSIHLAHRCRKLAGQVFDYAIQQCIAQENPAFNARKSISKVKNTKHRAAITDRKKVFELIEAIKTGTGTGQVRTALMLAPLLFLRPIELASLRWGYWNREERMLVIPSERTKQGRVHVVPLSIQAEDILNEYERDFRDPDLDSSYIFPSANRTAARLGEHINTQSLRAALKRLGYTTDVMTMHGFRAMADTMLHEADELKFDSTIIEIQMGHKRKDPLGNAYNRAAYMDDRRRMMQTWADFIFPNGALGLVSQNPLATET